MSDLVKLLESLIEAENAGEISEMAIAWTKKSGFSEYRVSADGKNISQTSLIVPIELMKHDLIDRLKEGIGYASR